MKILYVANVAKEHFCKFYINEFKELSRMGWEIDIACRMDADVPFVSHAFPMPWNRSPFRLSTFKGVRELRKIIDNNGYDILYCTTPIGGLVGRLAAKRCKFRPIVIYIAHGFHFFKGSSVLSWILYYPVEKWLAKYTDVLITVNSEDFLFAKKKFPVKKIVKINEIGANTGIYRKTIVSPEENLNIKKEIGIEKNFPILFYAAEISKLKNQTYLLSVIRELVSLGFDPVLLLPGRDQTSGRFQRRADFVGLKNRVKLLGFRQDLNKIIHVADFCTPSSRREGLGLNVVEAMAAGIPVVAVDNRGHRQTIVSGVNGFLVSIKSPDEMCSKIVYLINHPEIREKFEKNGIITSESYDFSAVFPTIMSIYSSSLAEKQNSLTKFGR